MNSEIIKAKNEEQAKNIFEEIVDDKFRSDEHDYDLMIIDVASVKNLNAVNVSSMSNAKPETFF